jgi:hypothetical protein
VAFLTVSKHVKSGVNRKPSVIVLHLKLDEMHPGGCHPSDDYGLVVAFGMGIEMPLAAPRRYARVGDNGLTKEMFRHFIIITVGVAMMNEVSVLELSEAASDE